MENDLISRSALWTDIMMIPHNGDIIFSSDVEEAIKDAPAIDVAPVVHAHWIKTFNSDGFVSTLRCSECGNAENSTYIPGNFCWFCGARMDAEEDG